MKASVHQATATVQMHSNPLKGMPQMYKSAIVVGFKRMAGSNMQRITPPMAETREVVASKDITVI